MRIVNIGISKEITRWKHEYIASKLAIGCSADELECHEKRVNRMVKDAMKKVDKWSNEMNSQKALVFDDGFPVCHENRRTLRFQIERLNWYLSLSKNQLQAIDEDTNRIENFVKKTESQIRSQYSQDSGPITFV